MRVAGGACPRLPAAIWPLASALPDAPRLAPRCATPVCLSCARRQQEEAEGKKEDEEAVVEDVEPVGRFHKFLWKVSGDAERRRGGGGDGQGWNMHTHARTRLLRERLQYSLYSLLYSV